MAVFFFLVGLELKRELLQGQLRSRRKAMLPALAALGGMFVPAGIFVALNLGSPENLRGWAIPAATDIAFALGILALVGSRAPVSLKLFLTALAVLDDLGAIAVIALFYTDAIAGPALALAAALCGVLFLLHRRRCGALAAYLVVGALLWLAVLKSGVHATMAGVFTAFAIPLHDRHGQPLLERLEHALHPGVLFGVVPLFAFANAGVSFAGLGIAELRAPLSLGIAAGLLIGKPLGILGATWLAVRTGLAELPRGATWRGVAGVSLLAGIGFTMSLFIGSLAFEGAEAGRALRLGILGGSLLAGALGFAVLRFAPEPHRERMPLSGASSLTRARAREDALRN